MGSPIRKAIAVMAHVAHRGVPVLGSIASQAWYKGTPPSRENAHSILQEKSHASGVFLLFACSSSLTVELV